MGNRFRDLPEWLEEFADNLEDAEVPAPANTSHDSDSERSTKVATRKYLYSLPKRPKLLGLHANQDHKGSLQKANWRTSTSSRKFWWLVNSRSQCPQRGSGISKQSPILNRGTRFSPSMDSISPVQNENFPGDGKEFTTVSRAVGKAESHLQWQFVGMWQILWRLIMESLYFNTSLFRDEWDCRKSGTQNNRRDACGFVAIRLGWKMAGWFCGMLFVICEMPKTSWQMGQHLMNGDLENHEKARAFRLTQRISSYFCERPAKAPPIWWESFCLEYSSDTHCIWEEFGKETCWLQTSRSCNSWTRQKSMLESSIQKGVSKPKMVKNIIFPVADGTVKLSGRDHRIRESTLRRDQSVRSGDLRGDLQGSSDGSQQMDEMVDDAEVRNDFWSIEGDFIHRHHVEPRFQLYVPKEETFPVPLSYINVVWGKLEKDAGMAADESQKRNRGDRWSQGKSQNSALRVINGHLKNSELEPKFEKYKGQVVLRGGIVKNDSGSHAEFMEQGSSASQMTAAKSHGRHCETNRMRRTSSRCNISLHPGQNGRCTVVIDNSKARMSRYLDASTRQMAKIMVQHGRPSCSSWAKSVRSSSGRTFMGKAVRESSITTRLGKSSKLGML